MSEGFVAGFSPRHQASVGAQLSAVHEDGFAPADLAARAQRQAPAGTAAGAGAAASGARPGPKSFSPRPVGPKHFAPAAAAAAPDPEAEAPPPPAWDGLSADPHGFADPIARARAEGFEEGLAHAQMLGEAARENDADLLARIAAQLASPARIDREALAEQLRQTVLLLVRQMMGELAVPAERLAARISAASGMIAEAAEQQILRLHPGDLPLVQPHLPATLPAVADAAIAPGHFTLESAATLVEDGPDHWLRQLSEAIERVGVPA